jgi:hypothetical protein
MSFVLDFLPEAGAKAECITGEYEARVPAFDVRFRRKWRARVQPSCSIHCYGGSAPVAIGA